MDTIYALASARGKSGVAVIRVSGPQAFDAGHALASSLPNPRSTAIRTLRNSGAEILDEALVLTFAYGASFTGEDIVEFHVHGSPAIINVVLRELSKHQGLRPAEAGEFTRRALENNCLDLARVEGLGDLIEAETETQRVQALRVFSGKLGDKVEVWRRDLIRAAALLEATIDFVDEDVPIDVTPEVLELLHTVLDDLQNEAIGSSVAERVRDGFEVAIVGVPNVGKSTLLNYLAGRDAAITSDIAGTTRDVIEVRMDLNGLPVTFLDTAGLRDSTDSVESIGIERSIERAAQADMRVFLIDATESLEMIAPLAGDVVLRAKGDISGCDQKSISGKTGQGVDWLIKKVTENFASRVATVGVAIQERHRVSILCAIDEVEACLNEVQRGEDRFDLAAEELRIAVRALDSLVGRVDVEHILDEIFMRFCIGK